MAAISQDNGSPKYQKDSAREHSDLWQIEPMSADLMDSPLDFIAASHQRQRQAALILNLISDGQFDRCGITDLIKYLEESFAFEISDQEIDFFPALRRHCQPEDNVDALIERLTEEHKRDEAKTARIVKILRGLLNGEKLNSKTDLAIRNLAEDIVQHVALENAVLLPIARVRMKAEALKSVAQAIKARHNPQK